MDKYNQEEKRRRELYIGAYGLVACDSPFKLKETEKYDLTHMNDCILAVPTFKNGIRVRMTHHNGQPGP